MTRLICINGEIQKIVLKLSSNTHLISFMRLKFSLPKLQGVMLNYRYFFTDKISVLIYVKYIEHFTKLILWCGSLAKKTSVLKFENCLRYYNVCKKEQIVMDLAHNITILFLCT